MLPLLTNKERVTAGAPSTTMNFQARLLGGSGAIVADGNYHVEFKLYNQVSGGSALWTETRTTGNLVSVKSGYLSVYLGSVSGFPGNMNWNEEHWLTMNIGGKAVSAAWDGEMNPRIKLTAVPFAFQAEQLAQSDGTDRGVLKFAGITNSPQITLPDLTGEVCLDTGNCGYGTGDIINGGQAGSISIGTTDNTSLFLETNNINRVEIQGDGDVAFNTNTLFVSAVNGRVGIGTATPAYTLDVVGDADLTGHVSIGDTTTPSAVAALNIGETYTNADTCTGFGCHGAIIGVTASNVTAGGINGLFVSAASAAGSYTLPQTVAITAGTNNAGAGTTITDNYGLFVQNQTAGTNDYGIYVQNADTYALWVDNGATKLDGTLQVGTLGTTDTDAVLCRNAAGQLAACTSTFATTTTAFVQGGNSFGATGAILGTNDNYGLAFETNNVTYFTLSNTGVLTASNNGLISVPGSGTNSERFGAGTSANGNSTLAVGRNATANGNQSVALGAGATTDGNSGTWQNGVAIGYGAEVWQGQSVAIGSEAKAIQNAVTLGHRAQANDNTVAIGQGANYSGSGTPNSFHSSVAIGQGATLGASNSIALGRGTTTTATNQMVIGSSTTPITSWIGGNGVSNATPFALKIQSTSAVGGTSTNTAGADITIASGQGTGNVDGGSILFQTSSAGASGTTLRSLTTKATLLGNGNFGIGDTSPAYLLTVGSGDLFGVNSSGNVILTALGSANTDTVLCRNSTNIVSTCTSTFLTNTTGFVQGGNTFGALPGNTAVLGTNDANSLALETNGTTRLTIDTSGNATLTGNMAVQGTGASTIAGSLHVDTNTLYVDAATNRVGIGTSAPNASLHIRNTSPTGTGTITSTDTTNTVTGSGTVFTTELSVGDTITANSQTRVITAITNNTSLTVNGDFSPDVSAGSSFTYQKALLRLDESGGNNAALIDSYGTLKLVNNGYNLSTVSESAIKIDSTITKDGVESFYGFNFSPTMNVNANPTGFGADFLFRDGTSRNINATSGVVNDDGGHATFSSAPTVNGTGNNNSSISSIMALQAHFILNKTGTGTLTAANSYGLLSTGTVNANTILTNRYGTKVDNATGTGAVTNQYGLFVDALTKGTNNAGLIIGETTGTNQANLVLGQTTIPSGAYSIYNASTDNNYFAGNLGIGDATPAYALTVGNGDLSGIDSTGAVGIKTGGSAATADLSFGQGADRTINVLARSTNAAGNSLTISAGAAGTGPSAFAGGVLTLQGGNAAGTGNANGGNVLLTGGAGTGTGVRGLVVIDTPTFTTATVQNFTGSGAITQANINNSGGILISSNAAGYTVTLGDPTITTAGKLLYVTNSGLFDMTLSVNGGGTGNTIALKPNTSATMVWNGSDWTAAGASSSTDLQSAYNNTLTSAGGAELVLNASGGSADGLTIRNNATTPISGGVLEVQSSIGTNLFSVNNLGTELAANGGAETTATFGTNWTAAPGGGSATQTTTAGEFVTGLAGVEVVTTGTSDGVRNNLSGNPVASTTYQVSFTAKLNTGTFTGLEVVYSDDGGIDEEACTSYSTQTLSTSVWTKITCTITTDAGGASNPDLIIRQPLADGTARTFWIDNLSFMRNDSTTSPSNVQIGGGINGGPITLFTLDRSTAPPVVAGNTTYLGSMYYDTTTGRIQCYEADGWGACGSAPDNIITLTPEYTGAVLNGSGIGTMTADFCGNGGGLSANTSFCASNEARNYYRWTSPQASDQTYSIYVTYKLPTSFKSFADDNTMRLTAYKDHATNAQASLGVYRKPSAGSIAQCGSTTVITTGTSAWNTTTLTGNETGCGWAAGDYVIFKIDTMAKSNASVYIENLDFTYLNQ